MDFENIEFNDFVKAISDGLDHAGFVIVVISPEAIERPWVVTEVDSSLALYHQGQLKGIIPVIAKPLGNARMPALWQPFKYFDATRDYAMMLSSLIDVLGITYLAGPRDFYVSATSNYTSISDAVSDARAGDTIHVAAGTYREGFVIDKPIKIRGSGRREEVIVTANGEEVVECVGVSAHISHITVQHVAEGAGIGAVFVNGGATLEMTDCDISSAIAVGVGIAPGSESVINACYIHDCPRGGISLAGHGSKAVVRDSSIQKNGDSGLIVRPQSSAIVKGSKINYNLAAALHVYVGGKCVAEDNDLRFNEGGIQSIDSNAGGITMTRNVT